MTLLSILSKLFKAPKIEALDPIDAALESLFKSKSTVSDYASKELSKLQDQAECISTGGLACRRVRSRSVK